MNLWANIENGYLTCDSHFVKINMDEVTEKENYRECIQVANVWETLYLKIKTILMC